MKYTEHSMLTTHEMTGPPCFRNGLTSDRLLTHSLLLALVCAWLTTGMCRAAAAGSPGWSTPNVVENGSFEAGLSGWQGGEGFSVDSNKNQARTGNASLRSDIPEGKRLLILKTKAPVQEGYVYSLAVWARGRGTALRLWGIQPGATQQSKALVGQLKNTGREWQQVTGTFEATASGQAEFWIVPSRFKDSRQPRAWLDDVSLNGFPRPMKTAVSGGVGYNDQPSMARTTDGALLVSWISLREGWDSLQIARFVPDSDRVGSFRRTGAWQVTGGSDSYLHQPDVVSAGSDAFVIYANEKNKSWNIEATRCAEDGPGPSLSVTSSASVDVKPCGAWHDGVLWVAWESNRGGSRQVCVSSLRDGRASPPETISDSNSSSYEPSVAILDNGEVCVAWHAFAANNYDVFMRRRSPTGEWAPSRRLTNAPAIDRHARLVARGAELWILYENAQMSAYSIGGTRGSKRLTVARVGPQTLDVLPDADAQSPLFTGAEAGDLAFGPDGRPWVAFVQTGATGWHPRLTGYTGAAWTRALPVAGGKGLDRAPALVVSNCRAVLAYQSDNSPRSFRTRAESMASASDIFLATAEISAAAPAQPLAFAPLPESDEPFEPGQLRLARGEDIQTPSITYQGGELFLYYGDLHDHTDISICGRGHDESINEAYQDMRDITRLDFACVTDHGYNINPYLWNLTAKLARINDDPGRFLTFLGEEWTSKFKKPARPGHPYGYYGHRNLVFADSYFPRWWNSSNGDTPAEVWAALRDMKANFVQIPHQLADNGGNPPIDWDYTDEVAQPVAEIFQCRGSYEYKGAPREARQSTPGGRYFLQDAWARGIVIGVIASPDHGGGTGKACVYAPELSREAILDAIRARHCFGTTAARIFLDVRVNGALMGEKIPAPGGNPVKVDVKVRCPADIDRVEICRSNQFVYSRTPDTREVSFTFVDEEPLSGPSYYYVRVLQKDQELAWSSPVWLGVK